jgi:hypothetical protein
LLIAKHLCAERYTTFEGKLFGVSKTAYVCFIGSSNLFSNPTTGILSNACKNNKNKNSNSKFKCFFDVFASAEGKEVRVASAVQRRSEGRASRGARGAKARFRNTSKRAGGPL